MIFRKALSGEIFSPVGLIFGSGAFLHLSSSDLKNSVQWPKIADNENSLNLVGNSRKSATLKCSIEHSRIAEFFKSTFASS